MSRRTETAYKAKSPGKAAQDVKAQDSGDMVNAAVVSRNDHASRLKIREELLSGEICLASTNMERIPQQWVM